MFCGMIDALAFLPEENVAAGMEYLRGCVPDGDESEQLMSLISYFDNTYVNGAARHVQRPAAAAATATTVQPVLLRRLPPLFPVRTWNVYDATLAGDDRTNNLCESWNRAFGALLGHNHPSVWCAIEGIQQDAAAATTALLQNSRGQPPVKRVKRSTARLQQQLHDICVAHRDGRKSVEETLRAVAHTVRYE